MQQLTAGDIVQSKRKPPILVPLASPELLPAEKLKARIQLIHNYAERYRELDDIEARELLELRYLLEHGVPKPKGHWWPGMNKKPIDEKLIATAIQELLK